MNGSVKKTSSIEDLRARRDEILALAEQNGAFNVRVFGSVARGEAMAGSDVDFLVQWDYNRVSPWGGVGFDLALETLLGCSVDVVSENGLSPLIKAQILREAIPL